MTDITSSGCNALRARNAMLGPDSDVVEIDFDRRVIKARKGESLLAALIASGEYRLRETRDGQFRGPFCGMGVCQECLVEVDGAPARRACMTKVDRAMTVRRQRPEVKAISDTLTGNKTRHTSGPSVLTPQIAVIGGGPGGMTAAAKAAKAGADVVLIDERPQLGGQFYKQPLPAADLQLGDFDDKQFRGGRQLIEQLDNSGAKVMLSTRVVGAYEPLDLIVSRDGNTQVVRPEVLIVSTGAYEVSYLFKGWTLPGVMTTGAAQTLLRSYRVLPGHRVMVAGNGPLNFQLAAELTKSGAQVVAVVEAAKRPGLSSAAAMARMLTASAGLTAKGAGCLSTLMRNNTSLIYGHKISLVDAIEEAGRPQLRAEISSIPAGRTDTRTFEVDAVCLGSGFRPNNEVLRTLGCKHIANPHSGALETVRDIDCHTSCENILAVGDCTRLGGGPMAQAEGEIAASTALALLNKTLSSRDQDSAVKARAMLKRHHRFQQALWSLFEAPRQLQEHVDKDAIVCRCEDLTYAAIQEAMGHNGLKTMASIKRATRAGMGRCQGRYCGPAIARMLAAETGQLVEEAASWAPRPPIKPIRIAELASLDLPDN